MRIAFMGTPEFAVPTLRALAASTDVVAVYTRPDAVSGRGGKTRPSPVKTAAEELGLPVLQPVTLRDPAIQDQFAEVACDLCVVAAYGMILPAPVLELPRRGCVNVHASLLPRWRGAAPIQRAILAGDAETGVSIMRMEEGLDTGPFCAQASVRIDDKDAEVLTSELAELGAKTLMSALPSIADGTVRWARQDDSLATYAGKILKPDVILDPDLDVVTAARRVRASSPAAPSRMRAGDIGLTVLEAARARSDATPGEFRVERGTVVLGFRDGALELRRVKPDGKQVMDAASWARGLRQPPETWGQPQ